MKRFADWREYQRCLRRRRQLSTVRRHVAAAPALLVIVGFTFLIFWHVVCRATGDSGGSVVTVQAEVGQNSLNKPALAGLLGGCNIDAQRPDLIVTQKGKRILYVQTTIDPVLQHDAATMLERSPSLRGACVVVDPQTGRVLVLANKNSTTRQNLCLTASPAASLFKLVTAAAAVEERQLGPETTLYFCGNPYSMPRPSPVRRTSGTEITLASALASSVNPVFGDLGATTLGAELLRRWGERFCFNRSIPFELALAPSHLEVPGDQFEIAKIAAGFNRRTTISPVHAALLAGAIASGGRMPEPTVVERVLDGRHAPLYTQHPAMLGEVCSEATAHQLRRMMVATVTEGTCRRSLLPELGAILPLSVEVGGKTGSIFGDHGKVKYDWFTGFALDRNSGRTLAIATFQEHGRYLGHKSSNIAGRLIRHYFDRLASETKGAAVRAAMPQS
ncbi:MAG: penicillin-binding transpeptidase domain-containing protein [Pseudomonadota bacterium]